MALAAVSLFILSAGWVRGAQAATTDYCPYGKSSTLLLVDRTTRFDATDKSVFLDALNGVVERLGAGDRLVMFTMTGAYTESRKVFDRCKPACPDEGFFTDLLATCRPVLARADYRGFVDELARDLADLLRTPEDTQDSDLFRTVAETTRAVSTASAQTLGALVIFSDLIENSPFLRQREFLREPPAETLRHLSAADIRPSLHGASVRVFGVGRDDTPARSPLPPNERNRVAQTWESWFRSGGAVSVDIGFR
ncbi:MAG TPA: hypothetical protein VHS58_22270 [Acetobacteraceae bacterium]|nr:hypothetical protein [Acetobacteraceae bacterium]